MSDEQIETNQPDLPGDDGVSSDAPAPEQFDEDLAAQSDPGEQETQPADDSEEIEHEGQKYKIQKASKLQLHVDRTANRHRWAG